MMIKLNQREIITSVILLSGHEFLILSWMHYDCTREKKLALFGSNNVISIC